MKDKERIAEKIRASAGKLEIPERLQPEEIGKLLERDGRRRRRRKHCYAQVAAAVAALAVFGSVFLLPRPIETEDWQQVETGALQEDQETAESPAQKQSFVREDAGDYYKVADSYDQVAEAVRNAGNVEAWYGAPDGISISNDSGANPQNQELQETSGQTEDYYKMKNNLANDTALQHSVTNAAVEGVDESDIVKTDGNYLYILDGEIVRIVDIRDGRLEETASFSPDHAGAAFRTMEMYVEGDCLLLITQNSIVTIDTQNTTARPGSVPENDSNRVSPDVQGKDFNDTTDQGEAVYLEEYTKYKLGDLTSTTLSTYDISDRSKPVLSGSITQDGAYKTSRKIKELVYLFTEQNVLYPSDTKDFATGDRWIPLVDGNKIASDSIYLPQAGRRGLIISSVDIREPEETVDNVMILNKNVDIYMSKDAFYLYRTEYDLGMETTQIARFRLKEGRINADQTASARGRVTDSFAVSELNGGLRLLTSERDAGTGYSQNHLYLFDKDLKLTGSLEGIAPGEQIYAARYIGDTAYFVTYRNTDPLFAADLSDPENPELIGEIKLTGFSEYLHPWEENMLLGIGYETDPETGGRRGVKLVMFDISDPSRLKVDSSYVISGSDQTPVADNWISEGYKTVLAEPGSCLIGLPVAINRKGEYKEEYHLYGWNGEDFTLLVQETFEEFTDLSGCRGLYAGDVFFITGPGQVTAYDMKKDFERIKTLKF